MSTVPMVCDSCLSLSLMSSPLLSHSDRFHMFLPYSSYVFMRVNAARFNSQSLHVCVVDSVDIRTHPYPE